ncbi:MAG TPA: efflux RND transporter periplasmic adaptor subunit [Vicinamibacterales bacterium]|nr:efflux RND transporter periplasmic adaptor subunit [Vicinamibacterales bacterium]
MTHKGPIISVIAVIVGGGLIAAWGIADRGQAMTELARETREQAVSTVVVTTPSRGAASEEVALPGNVQPYTEAAIYARTTGYLKARFADIGSRVKAGQVLAEIDTPETDQQLLQAGAELASAQANAALARTTAARYEDLIKTDSVSRQDLDNAVGSYGAKKAAVLSAEANLKRLEELQRFKTIHAPFAGVITARSTDIGALIGSGTAAKELFHIAAVDRLRVFVEVPQIYSRAARPGVQATIGIQDLPGRAFTGTLARTAQSIDMGSRTLLVEIELDNKGGEILPGSFAQVHLKLPTDATTFRLPVNTLIFRSEGLRVAAVKNGAVRLIPITIGRDFGSTVEVVAGLTGGESIVVNPSDSLADGQTVTVAPADARRGRP